MLAGSWTSMTEATFTELRTSAAFDLVGSVGANQVLWCTSSVDLVHQCIELVLDSVLDMQCMYMHSAYAYACTCTARRLFWLI